MDAADGYVGDDGRRYRNPCTSKSGQRKERWPSEKTAIFVVELVALGMHRHRGRKKMLYPYHCPRCNGWHLATCRAPEHFEKHEKAMMSARQNRNQNSANAG